MLMLVRQEIRYKYKHMFNHYFYEQNVRDLDEYTQANIYKQFNNDE